MTLREAVSWIKKNWDKIPDEFKQNIKPDRYKANMKELNMEGHIVVLLVDRQKPSVEAYYDFDEERFGVNRFGDIIWGFDSGCSCPSPWWDAYPDCYSVSKTWKEFKVNIKDFDRDFEKEALKQFKKIKRGSKWKKELNSR